MKNSFIVTLLFFYISATVGLAQTKKPTTTTKKATQTVKSSVPKTTTKKTTTTTKTTTPVTQPPVVEGKKTTTTTTTTTTPTETKSTTTPSTTTTTTTTQSSGPSKGKKNTEPKPERVREPKPERVKQPKPEKVRVPREPNGSAGGVRFGIRAEGSQIVSFETGGQPDFSPGFNAGLIVNIPINKKISIQPEVLYSMITVKVSDPAMKNDFVKGTNNSIFAPITFNFNLGSGSTKFMINPGGYASYLLSGSLSQSIGGVSQSGSVDLTGVDKFGYGAVLGLGVKINGDFLIEARSFYDLKESNNKIILSTIGVGYMF